MSPLLEASLSNIIQQPSLKWIFVGGKGGVGKTTTSCSLATQLAKSRPNVLLISTDPAHSLSDAFGQKLSSTPSLIGGYSNLYAMEIDPNTSMQALGSGGEGDSLFGPLLSEFTSAIPGIDEAMGFAEVMKLVKSMEYSTIVFDTAPTGHTLRFLSFPATLERALQKLGEMSGKFGPLISQFSALMGGGGAANTGIPDSSQINSKLAELKAVVEEVNSQFQDPEKTTFVCVMIAEFLSLYETERMIQDLCRFQIDTHNLVVNQLVFPETADCGICQARRKMQKKYLDQIDDLYGEDFHIVKLPLLKHEVRGSEEIKRFSRFLIEPYEQGNRKVNEQGN